MYSSIPASDKREDNTISSSPTNESGTMSVLEALKTFCQTTSIKGLPRMIRSKILLLRVMWAFTVLFGSAVALYQIIFIIKAYFAYETSTSIEELEGTNPIFPDVTVCKTNPPPIISYTDKKGDPSRISFKEYLEEVDKILKTSTVEEKDTLEALYSLEGYFRTITDRYPLHSAGKTNFTVRCVYKYRNSEDVDCSTSTKPRFLTPSYPACVNFKPATFAHRNDIHSLTAIFYLDDFNPGLLVPNFGSDAEYPQTAGVVVFTHAPNTFPNLLTGLTAAPGAETLIKVIDRRRVRENDPYSDCSGTNYEELDDDADFSYTEHSCRDNCTQKRAVHECSCLDPRVPTHSSQRSLYSFCGALPLFSNTSSVNSSSRKDTVMQSLTCLHNSTDSRSEKCDVHCVEKCHSLSIEYHGMGAPWPHESRQLGFYNQYIKGKEYPSEFKVYEQLEKQFSTAPRTTYEELQQTTLIGRNFLKVKVFFDGRTIIQYRDSPVYTPSSVSGSLGGILNLWIGISFVTVMEIAELIYNLLPNIIGRHQPREPDSELTSNQDRQTRN